jgi:hypothetical protein
MQAAPALDRPPVEVRSAVKAALPASDALSHDDRKTIANSLVRIAHAARLLDQEARPQRVARALNAADEYGGTAIDRMAPTAQKVIQAISFPRFVNELITGVFRAMLQTEQAQLQQYVELVRSVSQSLEGWDSLGGNSDDPAKRWLAEQFPQSFTIEAPDPDDKPEPGEPPEPLQLISMGSPPSEAQLRAALNLEPDAQVPSGSGRELVAFVRRSIAKNRQQMLATMVQMGMQRLVIDSGRISASMRFHIDASSAAEEQSHSGFDTRTTIGASASGGFGIWSASASVQSTIGYVRTDDLSTREATNASADLNSSVELQFRTDQIPLDRIASERTVERLRLNTLNPEKELQIAAETDRARIAADQAIAKARLDRKTSEFAPPLEKPAGTQADQLVGAIKDKVAGKEGDQKKEPEKAAQKEAGAKPADKPPEKPADKPAEKPADKPAADQTAKPTEKPADKPAANPSTAKPNSEQQTNIQSSTGQQQK